MIDDPKLIKAMDGKYYLVQLCIIVHGIYMVPVRPAVWIINIVQVNQLRMVGNSAVICLGGVMILDQVIPDVPFPDNIVSVWVHLNNCIRP